MRRFLKSTWNTLSLRLSLLLPVVLLFSAMVSATAFAEVQEVSLNPSSVMVAAGAPVSLALIYDVDINDNTLVGVGIRIHYDSSLLTYTGPSNVFSTGLATAPDQPQADTGNEDGDSNTDMIFLFGYSDPFGPGWPNQPLPLTLADLGFTADAAASPGAVTNVNVTFTSNPVGYTGAGNNAIITIICENGTTRSCGSDTGECVAGLETCVGGAWSGVCEGEVGPTTDETCDGLDNDCDGTADEGYVADTSCYLPGTCSTSNAASTCISGIETSCSTGTPAAGDATCDGLDNDCDGTADEDYVADTSCYLPGTCSASNVASSCVAGSETSCSTGTPAADDATCDGIDDDCDGQTDEEAVDTDNDTVCDSYDVCPGSDDTVDADADGVPDGCDVCPGYDDTLDADADGVPDGCDNAPFNANPPSDCDENAGTPDEQCDTDGDGVGDAAEMGPTGADPLFDGNGDGFADFDQKNVATLLINLNQDYVTLSTALDCTLEDLVHIPTDEVADLPVDVGFPLGMFEFIIRDCVLPDTPVIITLKMPAGTNLPGSIGVNTYYKLGPEPGDLDYHWYDFIYDPASQTGVTFLDDTVTMTFLDGAKGDDGLVVDGAIIDMGGPAFIVGGAVPPTTSTGGSSSSSLCFIETLFSSFWKNK